MAGCYAGKGAVVVGYNKSRHRVCRVVLLPIDEQNLLDLSSYAVTKYCATVIYETYSWGRGTKGIFPGDAFSAERHYISHRHRCPLHVHADYTEVFWIDSGHATHRINGAGFPLRPGNLVFMRRQDCHTFEPAPGELLRLTNISFPQESADFLRERYFATAATAFWSKGKEPVCLQIDPAQQTKFNHWADALAQAPRKRLYIERFLLDLLAELAPPEDDLLPEKAPDWLMHACRQIQDQEHFSQGVDAFFRLAGRSREHVARSTAQFLGMTPTDYVNRVRMKYAERQLRMSKLGILEIALDCGLENLSHFYALFRKEFGTMPRAYRLKDLTSNVELPTSNVE